MKLTLLLGCAALVSQVTLSQSSVKIKHSSSSVKMKYPALVQALTKENTYNPVFPEKLTYYASHREMQMDGILFSFSDMPLKAKNKGNTPDVTFVIEASGITNVQFKGIRNEGNAYALDYTYNFPCRLLIKDAALQTLYSFDVFTGSEEHSILYIKSTPKYNTMMYSPVYFGTEKEAREFQTGNKDISRYIERYAMLAAYKKVAIMMTALYTDYSERRSMVCAFIPDAGGVAEYSKLNTAADQLKQAYSLLDAGNTAEADKVLQSAKAVFQQQSDVKKMTDYNLAWASVLTGDAKTALELYKLHEPTSNGLAAYGWNDLYAMAQLENTRNQLRNTIKK
ncbi:MAG: hypothetical protein ABW007_09500 [Chitinophagaceae bacterium]